MVERAVRENFCFAATFLMNYLQSPLKKCKFGVKSPLKKCQIFDLYYVTKKDRTDAWGLEKSRHR